MTTTAHQEVSAQVAVFITSWRAHDQAHWARTETRSCRQAQAAAHRRADRRWEALARAAEAAVGAAVVGTALVEAIAAVADDRMIRIR